MRVWQKSTWTWKHIWWISPSSFRVRVQLKAWKLLSSLTKGNVPRLTSTVFLRVCSAPKLLSHVTRETVAAANQSVRCACGLLWIRWSACGLVGESCDPALRAASWLQGSCVCERWSLFTEEVHGGCGYSTTGPKPPYPNRKAKPRLLLSKEKKRMISKCPTLISPTWYTASEQWRVVYKTEPKKWLSFFPLFCVGRLFSSFIWRRTNPYLMKRLDLCLFSLSFTVILLCCVILFFQS